MRMCEHTQCRCLRIKGFRNQNYLNEQTKVELKYIFAQKITFKLHSMMTEMNRSYTPVIALVISQASIETSSFRNEQLGSEQFHLDHIPGINLINLSIVPIFTQNLKLRWFILREALQRTSIGLHRVSKTCPELTICL